MTSSTFNAEYAAQLDAQDALAPFRQQFHLPQRPDGTAQIYFVGNSLGLQPYRTREFLQQELDKWRELGVEGHFHGEFPWMPYHEFLSASMARVVGALPQEVVVMNSLTVNLHLMLTTFFRPQGKRTKILLEEGAFPSDHFAVESHLQTRDLDPAANMLLVPADECGLLDHEQILATIKNHADELALILLPGVQYYSGQLLDMPSITAAARECGIAVGFDLAHAAGNVELALHDWDVDFAVWCSYKYLNSGPGSLGGCFVHQRHASQTELPRLAGWWGQDKATRFEMKNEFRAIPTAEGWQLSNPPILSMAAIRAALGVFDDAGGMLPLVEKSRKLTGFFADGLHSKLANQVRILTPAEPTARGCQLSLEIDSEIPGKEVFERLMRQGIITDWRHPNVIRAAPVPLYNTYTDVYRFVEALDSILNRQ